MKARTGVTRLLRRAKTTRADFDALSALALRLAEEIDAGPPAYAVPALARELRMTIRDLVAGQDDTDRELRDLLDGIARP